MGTNNDREKQSEKYSYKYGNIKTEVKIEQTRKDNGEKDTYVTKKVYVEKK